MGHNMRAVLRISAFAAVLAGCTTFPQLDAVVSDEARRADYPRLVPAAGLLAKRSEGRLTETSGEALLARAARLQARARILRNVATIDEETRLRIAARLRRLGG